jgi:hypothetical protein
MNSDCIEVDELILQLADYKNDYADVATEKLLRKCPRSWEAYQCLENHAHDAWLPDSARQQLRRVINRIRVRMRQQYPRVSLSLRDHSLVKSATLEDLLN